MLHPSYTDLMKVVNQDVEEGETKIVNSRYSIVLATSKRARQIINGQLPLVNAKDGMKPLSLAIQEMSEGKLKIIAEKPEEEITTDIMETADPQQAAEAAIADEAAAEAVAEESVEDTAGSEE